MSAQQEKLSPLDILALDVIDQYSHGRYNLSLSLKEGLLKLIPDSIKTSSTVLRVAVDSLMRDDFRSRLYERDTSLTLFDLSLAAAETLSDLDNHPRTTIELATGYWTLGPTARLSHRRINEWQATKRDKLAEFRAHDAWQAIKQGRIEIDRSRADGEYVVYQLTSGLYELLEPGLVHLNIEKYGSDVSWTKHMSLDEIGAENYQTT